MSFLTQRVRILVISTGLGQDSKPAVLPEHSLGAEPMRRLDNGHQHGGADRTQAWDGAKQFPGWMFLAVGEEFDYLGYRLPLRAIFSRPKVVGKMAVRVGERGLHSPASVNLAAKQAELACLMLKR